MKNILYVDFSSGYGGSSVVLYDYLKYCDRQKFNPILLIIRDGENFDLIRKLGIEVIKLDIKILGCEFSSQGKMYFWLLLRLIRQIFLNTKSICKVIKDRHIDLVHINTNIYNNIDSILACRLTGRICVCHIRQTNPLVTSEKIFGRLIDQVIVLNSRMYEMASRILGRQKINLVSDGLDLNVSYQGTSIRKEYQLGNAFCAAILGRVVRGKGIEDFIQAAAIVRKSHQNVRFLVIGSNPDQESGFEKHLKTMIRDLQLQDHVLFIGWRNDKFDILKEIDVLVQASSTYPEGFGLTCIEAMLMSKPVIATNIPGPKDIIIDSETGFIIPAGDSVALADRVLRLINNPQQTSEMGKNGRKLVAEKFDIKEKARKIELIYQILFERQ